MAVRRIAERVHAPFAGAAVDRERGVIRGVKLCGGKSVNGRDYPPEVFRRDVRKYQGAAIYADHGRDRSVDRKLGWIDNPHVDEDGTPRGDAHLLTTHPLYERVMEAAERNPGLFGFSHVALCETSFGPDGRERVEGLRTVESVDLVAEPATTRGLFEHRNANANQQCDDGDDSFNTRSAMSVTIRELAAWVTRHPRSTTRQILAAKRLAEMDSGDMGDEPAADAMDDDAGPDDAVTGGFKAALLSVIEKALAGDMAPAIALKKIKTLLSAHCDATADDSDTDTDSDSDSDDDTDNDASPEQPSSESRRGRGERPASASRLRVSRHAETRTPRNRIPEGGQAFARWVAE